MWDSRVFTLSCGAGSEAAGRSWVAESMWNYVWAPPRGEGVGPRNLSKVCLSVIQDLPYRESCQYLERNPHQGQAPVPNPCNPCNPCESVRSVRSVRSLLLVGSRGLRRSHLRTRTSSFSQVFTLVQSVSQCTTPVQQLPLGFKGKSSALSLQWTHTLPCVVSLAVPPTATTGEADVNTLSTSETFCEWTMRVLPLIVTTVTFVLVLWIASLLRRAQCSSRSDGTCVRAFAAAGIPKHGRHDGLVRSMEHLASFYETSSAHARLLRQLYLVERTSSHSHIPSDMRQRMPMGASISNYPLPHLADVSWLHMLSLVQESFSKAETFTTLSNKPL